MAYNNYNNSTPNVSKSQSSSFEYTSLLPNANSSNNLYQPQQIQNKLIVCRCKLAESGNANTLKLVVDGEPEVYQLLTRAISTRSRPTITKIYETYEKRRDVIMLFQTLAYIMEYCRYSKKRFFYIEPSNPDCKPMKLDLKELISFPKQCCQRGCIKDGLISCSRCLVACWCSPECLDDDFLNHKIPCTVGEHILQDMSL